MSDGAQATQRVALVTGAASGIGGAVAGALSRSGWKVATVDLRNSTSDLPLIADVGDPAAVTEAVEGVEAEFGRVDLLVTAAGYHEFVAAGDLDADRWERMLRVHLGGTYNLCRAVLPGMLGRASGDIVTISSELALSGGEEDCHYASAKGAIIGLTKSLALEVADRGVKVNCVAPGPTDTPLLASRWRSPEYLQTLPLRRLVTPEEVAQTVLFLAEEGEYFCGQVLSPNGGAVI